MRKIGILSIVMFLLTALFSSYINHAESNNKRQKLHDKNLTEEPIQKNKDSNVLVLDYSKNEPWKGFKYDKDESYLSIYKKPLDNDNFCDIFIIKNADSVNVFMTYDSAKDAFYRIKFDDHYMDYGLPSLKGFSSPDGRYVYAIGDIMANSTGWIATFQIYQIDTSTLKTKFINAVAAWRMEKDGFTVASETRCITPKAKFSAQKDFAFKDITYGYDGKVRHRSKEYPSKEIKKRYKNPKQRSV